MSNEGKALQKNVTVYRGQQISIYGSCRMSWINTNTILHCTDVRLFYIDVSPGAVHVARSVSVL